LKKVNPLNVLEIRQVDFCPSYFETVTISPRYNLIESIKDWIVTHLSGRFFIGQTIGLDQHEAIETQIKIGFEEKKELSYFMLACPHLKYT